MGAPVAFRGLFRGRGLHRTSKPGVIESLSFEANTAALGTQARSQRDSTKEQTGLDHGANGTRPRSKRDQVAGFSLLALFREKKEKPRS